MSKQIRELDFEKATADEMWQWCMLEYQSQNPIVRRLYENFFVKLSRILGTLDPDARVLEVGCGAGESSRRVRSMLLSQHFEVSEFDERYVQKLIETDFPIPVRQESVYELQRKDNEFDCILLLEVLEHLEDYELALSELFRVSSRYVVISVPNEPLWRILNFARGKYISDLGNTPGHINHWSPRTLKQLISRYGSVRKIYRPLPWIMILAEKSTLRAP